MHASGGKSTLKRVAYRVESGFVLLVVPFIVNSCELLVPDGFSVFLSSLSEYNYFSTGGILPIGHQETFRLREVPVRLLDCPRVSTCPSLLAVAIAA